MNTTYCQKTGHGFFYAVMAALCLWGGAASVSGQTVYGSWQGQNGGNWTDSLNWVNGSIPGWDTGSSSATATPSHVANVILDFAANRTINVNSEVRLGVLNIGDITGGQTLTLTSGPIIFDNSSFNAMSLFNKVSGGGNDTISSDIVLEAVGDTRDVGRGLMLNLNASTTNLFGNISGDQQGLFRRGAGNLQLNGANSFTGRFTNATTGGTVFLGSTTGVAISSTELYLGTSSRDGNASSVIELQANSQINAGAIIYMDGAGSRNPFLRLRGFNQEFAGIFDYSREGVIEHSGSLDQTSTLTMNMSSDSFYNGYIRDTNGGVAARRLGLTKMGTGTLTLAQDRINFTGPTNVLGGTLALVNTNNFGSPNVFSNPQFATINIAADAHLQLGTLSNWNLNATFSGAGDVTKTGASSVTLLRTTGHTGATIIKEGVLLVGAVNNDAFSGGVTASIQSTSAVHINGGQLALLNRSDATGGNASNRIGDSIPIITQSGSLDYIHNAGTVSYAETVGKVFVGAGLNFIREAASATGQSTTLTLSGIGGSMGSATGGLTHITVTSGGTGYVLGTLEITISGGGGVNATATPVVDGSGVITAINITDPGTGYTAAPTITINGNGSGTGAVATATLGYYTSSIAGFGITNKGTTTYTTAPTVVLTGGGGTGATAVALLGVGADAGKVVRINVTNPGWGYTSPPIVSFTGGGGAGAAAYAGLVRQRGDLAFRAAGLGDNNANRILVNNAPTLINNIIGGWAVASSGPGGANFATLEGASNSVRALQTYDKIQESAYTFAKNVQINGTAPATLTANRAINSLKIDDGTARTLLLGSVTSTTSPSFRTLTIETGGLISAGGAHIIRNGALTAGAASGFELHTFVGTGAGNTLRIESRIVDNDNDANTSNGFSPVAVVKAGQGRLLLYGTNTYTGGTTINEGVVEINGIGGLGGGSSAILPTLKQDFLTLNGGTLQIPLPAGSTTTTEVIFGIGESGVSNNKGITVGPGGGIFALNETSAQGGQILLSTKLYLQSKITGPGGIKMGGTGSTGGRLIVGNSPGSINDFEGRIWQDLGVTELGGTNTTRAEVLIDGGSLIVTRSTALSSRVNQITLNKGKFLLGVPSFGVAPTADLVVTVGSLVNGPNLRTDSLPEVGLDRDSTVNGTLVVRQNSNSTFSGIISDASSLNNKNFSLVKEGKGNLTLSSRDNAYQGSTTIREGVLTVAHLDSRGVRSSIGQGQAVVGSQFGASAPFLVIEDGGALAVNGTGISQTNRSFTLGSGPMGAAIYANGPTLGSTLVFSRGIYTDPGTFMGVSDVMKYKTPDNGAATLILGGSNTGENRFGQPLVDNGTFPLSLQKTGVGQWILGQFISPFDPATNPSLNSFSGRTSIFQGTVVVERDHVFGAAGGDAVQVFGGILELRAVDYTTLEDLSLAGGRLRSLTGTSRWAGSVRLDSNATVEVGPDATIVLRTAVAGSGALRKEGFGTLVLQGANTYLGSTTVAEGVLRVDYTDNVPNKLANATGLFLGGGRQGGTLDIVGGTTNILEELNGLTLGLGENRVTRSDAGSNTRINLNAISVQQGATLDVSASNIAATTRPIDPTGILGSWATVGKTSWATVGSAPTANKPIIAYTAYTNDLWSGPSTNTDVITNTTQTNAITSSLRFNQPASLTLTLVGLNQLRSGGVLQTANVGANSNIIRGGSLSGVNNATGGFLTFHQFDAAGALRIDSIIANAPDAGDFVVDYVVTSVAGTGSTNLNFQPGTGPDASLFYVGMPVKGPDIPPGATITAITPNTGVGLVTTFTINRNAAGSIAGQTVTIGSNNGLLKDGEGTLFLNAKNLYSGPTIITGGTLSIRNINNGTAIGTPADPNPIPVGGGIGSSSRSAANLRIGGAALSYVGDNNEVDRGFTINEIGAIGVADEDVTLGFTGDLSGGGGAGFGTLQKVGAGTLEIIRKAVPTVDAGGVPIVDAGGNPVLAVSGGATNFGGFEVKGGTLRLKFDNANINNGGNNFAATTASLLIAGGSFQLQGLANKGVTQPPVGTITDFNENRVQDLRGQLSLGSGENEIRVTSGLGATTTLNLQDAAVPTEVVRAPGATVRFVEDDVAGGVSAITLAVPSVNQGIMPWSTYWRTGKLDDPGVNNFASIEALDDGVISADSKDLYTKGNTVAQWTNGVAITEAAGSFSGTTKLYASPFDTDPTKLQHIFVLRFYDTAAGTINIADKLNISGGGILVGNHVGNNKKQILGGELTSSGSYDTIASSADLIIHNYNPANPFEITSAIVDGNRLADGSLIPVNLVHVGDGSTILRGTSTYTGTTFVSGGVLRLASAMAIPGGIGATGGTSPITINTGIIGLENGDFLRGLGTASSQISFSGSGGFAAYGGTRDINFGGAAASANYGSGGFLPDGATFVLGNDDATGMLRVLNPLNLGGTERVIRVPNGTALEDAVLLGNISGNGGELTKTGAGALRLSGIGTYTDGTTIGQGTLIGHASAFGAGPIHLGSSDNTKAGYALKLVLEGGSVGSMVMIGDKSGEGAVVLTTNDNTTLSGVMALEHRLFLGGNSAKQLTVTGAISGVGAFSIIDGVTLALNGANTFGTGAGVSGAAFDGAISIRNGTVLVGHSTGLGDPTRAIEVGGRFSSYGTVKRSTNGQSVTVAGGVFDPTSNGLPGSSNGKGAFLFVGYSSITIDGAVFNASSAGQEILLNGESDNSERNGIYKVVFTPAASNSLGVDVMALNRVDTFDDVAEMTFGKRVVVEFGTEAGKTYFLATTVTTVNTSPIHWLLDVVNANVALLASAPGLTIANNIDLNNGSSTANPGTTTLGGSSQLSLGSSTFSGNVVLQDIVPGTVEAKTLLLTSDTRTDRGVVFSGTISESNSADRLSLVKEGTGTVTLLGANTYHGTTTVNAGSLLVSNASGSATGTGKVTLNNVGTLLGGTGTLTGETVMNAGTILSPGDPTVDGGIAALTFGGKLTLNGAVEMVFTLASGSVFDKVHVNGLLTIDPAAIISVLLDFVPGGEFEFDLIDWGTRVFSSNIIDQLMLPALTDDTLLWDTALFASQGKLRIVTRNEAGPPPVRFAVSAAKTREGQSTVSVAVQLAWSKNSVITVPIAISGTATLSSDYTVSLTPLTFAPGETAKTMTFTIADDVISEGTETIVLSIGTPTGAIKGTPSAFTLTLEDNDQGSAIGETWTLRNPLPSNEDLTDVASNGSVHIAVGSQTTVLRSTDGINWTAQNIGLTPAQTLTAVEWTGTNFVAVGTAGLVVTSPDGIAWTMRSVTGGQNLRDLVVQDAGAVVNLIAVGDGGTIYSSDNEGQLWLRRTSNTTQDLAGIVNATIATVPTFIAVGKAGTVLTSINGAAWTASSIGTADNLNSIAWKGDLAVVVGAAGAAFTSPDGTAWTPVTSGTANDLLGVSWDGSRFIASGAAGTIRTSTNGSTWAAATVVAMADKLTRSTLTQPGGLRLMVGGAGTLLSSSDGTTWIERSVGSTANLASVIHNSAEFYAVGASGTVLHSTAGVSWTQVGSLPTSADLNDIAAATTGTQMVAVGNGGTILNSATGATWTAPSSPTAFQLDGVVKATTNWVVVGNDGTVLTSPNGTTWTLATSGITTDLFDAAANGNMVVAVGDGGTIIYSNNSGVTWSPTNSTVTTTLRTIHFDGSLFVVAGGDSTPSAPLDGTILTSNDGTTWIKRTAGTNTALAGATHAVVGAEKPRFVVGTGGAILGSTAGVTWSRKASGTTQNLADITSQGTTMVAVGAAGTIATSETVAAPPAKVFFAITDVTGDENVLSGAPIAVVVNLSSPPPGKITVPYTVTGTATKGADYTVPAGTSLVFDVNKGEVSKTIFITVKNDGLVNEGDQTVLVKLGTPSAGVAVVNGTYTLTIQDTDTVPTVALVTTSQIVALGTPFTLNATVTGNNTPTVQWRKAGVAVAGAVGASYTFPAIALINAGKYSAKATNLSGSVTSAPASDIEIAVVDTAAHVLPIKNNTTAVIAVGAAGNGLSYAWEKNGNPLSDAGDFTGTHTSKLSIKTFDASEEDFYTCVVSRGAPFNDSLESGAIHVVVAETPIIQAIAANTLPPGRVGTVYEAGTNGFLVPIDTAVHKTPTKFTATNLPTGLTINATTGVISGRPTLDGTKTNIVITATNPAGFASTPPLTLFIDDVEPTALGTYVGLIDRNPAANSNLGARLDLTTTKDGGFTGKLTIGSVATAFKGGLLNTVNAVLPHGTISVPVTGRPTMLINFDLDAGNNTLIGTLSADAGATTVPLHGWRNTWSTTNSALLARSALYNVVAPKPGSEAGNIAIPQGDSYLAIKLVIAGTATVAGKTADGSVIATTAPLGPTGQVLIYQPLYTNTGSFHGEASIANLAGTPGRSKVTGNATWNKAAAAATAKVYNYKAGFAPIDLALSGGNYVAPTGTNIVMSLPSTAGVNARLLFDAGGVGIKAIDPTNSATDPDANLRIDSLAKVTLPVPNTNALSLTITTATGAFTGTVTLKDSTTVRKVTYQGLIIPDADNLTDAVFGVGHGYFLLSQLPQITGETLATTPILSGIVELKN